VNDNYLTKDNQRTGQFQERQVTEPQLLGAHEQFAEPIQPGEGALDDPPSGTAPWVPPRGCGVATLPDVRNAAALAHGGAGGLPSIALGAALPLAVLQRPLAGRPHHPRGQEGLRPRKDPCARLRGQPRVLHLSLFAYWPRSPTTV